MHDVYELYYWPAIQGRGELVRLALEETGAPYIDVARIPERGGTDAITSILLGLEGGGRHFAPPVLKSDDLVIAQTSCILDYLATRHPLLPDAEPRTRYRALEMQLTFEDFITEIHQRNSSFLEERLPKFLRYFEYALRENKASKREHLVGGGFSYVDLTLFHVLSGVANAFPNVFDSFRREIPLSLALRDRVASRPRVAAYLGSTRRVPFSDAGVFRYRPYA